MFRTKTFISLQKGFLSLMSAALLFSCSTIETFEMEGMNLLRASGLEENDLASCKIHCISDEEPESYQKLRGENSVEWGNHEKTLKYVAYNTEETFVIEVEYSRISPGGVRVGDVKVTFGEEIESQSITSENSATFTFPLPAGWEACDEVSFTIEENTDEELEVGGIYSLYGTCNGCEGDFDYVSNSDGTYTFTFVSEETIEGAELIFTFPQGIVTSGLESWTEKGSTMQTTLTLAECGTYSWTVGLDANCSGARQRNANLWTDFTVNGESKKRGLSNITKACN